MEIKLVIRILKLLLFLALRFYCRMHFTDYVLQILSPPEDVLWEDYEIYIVTNKFYHPSSRFTASIFTEYECQIDQNQSLQL